MLTETGLNTIRGVRAVQASEGKTNISYTKLLRFGGGNLRVRWGVWLVQSLDFDHFGGRKVNFGGSKMSLLSINSSFLFIISIIS